MTDFVTWLESHENLAGWAQFFGAMLALAVTYFTAFAPTWRRKRRIKSAASHLLSDGYVVIESYHRTSAYFLPFPLSLRAAASSMMAVINEINRFPIFELDDPGSRSMARHLKATSQTLLGLHLFLEDMATNLEGREATEEEHEMLKEFVGERLESIQAMLSGAELKRPEWSGQKG